MLPLARGLALAATAALMSGPADTLRVMRVSPSGEATPTQPITVTFDRPVAGSLDYSVDASRVFRIDPPAPGRVEWRDPVTIAFYPLAPLRSDTRYRITVANTFRAMDGSRLLDPFEYTIRVKGATLLTGSPVGKEIVAKHVVPDSRFELVWSAPVDPDRVAAASYLEFNSLCQIDERIMRLDGVRVRPVRESDPWTYRAPRYEEGMPQEPDSLRRVVELDPRANLPYGCTGDLVAPAELNTGNTKGLVRWPFSTYGPLRIAETSCTGSRYCPTGPILVVFSTPVKGTEVQRRVRILPATPFTLRDSTAESDAWVLQAKLRPRTTYAIVVDTAMRDVFGQKLEGNPASAVRTTGYAPSVSYPYGRMLVERNGFATLAVQHVNVDTLVATIAPVPDTLESQFLRRSVWGWGDLWKSVAHHATTRRLPVRAGNDAVTVTGIKLPTPAARGPRAPTLYAVKVSGPVPDSGERQGPNIALVQVTDLGVHAKVGPESGVVWVTGVEDGMPRADATVTLYDFNGRSIASSRTDARGIARLAGYRGSPTAGTEESEDEWTGFEGYVGVVLGGDRALIGISQYDPDLSPWRFNVPAAWGSDRLPVAGAVFTERGIYRPGETVYAKTIVREGSLGALAVPARDSVRWQFKDREGGTLADTVMALGSFGTAQHTLELPATAPLGHYELVVQAKRPSGWVDLTRTSYRVAEYRPPEFLVDVATQGEARLPGDTLHATVQARYLFGAPMARAALTWQARQTPVSSQGVPIPNTDGYYLGESGWWWEEGRDEWNADVFAGGTDTLDAGGGRAIAVALPAPAKGRAARVTFSASVTDVNRQVVGSSATVIVHPASIYVAAKTLGKEYFWRAGRPESVAVLAVRPTGERVSGVAISGTIVRREWHQVRRERGGMSEVVGEWVSDTVGRCALRSASEQVVCGVTPTSGGSYIVSFRATDEQGRVASTSFYRWATGPGWVPWYDESRFKMDVIPDRARYSVGDTATVLLASPFTDAEAWITVEREGLIEQRRMTITSGSTSLRLPITEAYVPNAFVSVFVTRGRSAPPGRLDDAGRPTIRVGYAELRVTHEVKRLTVNVEPVASEYRPGDTARVQVRVRDASGAGQRAEVTLWAVDEGVLALTGYETPDPLDLLYRPRGLGMRLASNLVSVAPQIPEGEKGARSPGGGGGQSGTDILRSRFKTTAFFLGSVVTAADGRAVALAKLPDNLTTFRVMAVAVTAGDRYGSGHSPMLVTRPLIARSALPRFVRAGDEFTAGTVINQRGGGTPAVEVTADARGVALRGARSKRVTLEAGRGREVRFEFRAGETAGDSATFRFGVSGAGDADAVQARLPIRPDYQPRTVAASGVVRDTASVELTLPADVDPARSRLTVSLGSSPLAIIRGAEAHFRVYPYYCTEQVISTAWPLVALYRARQLGAGDSLALRRARRQIEIAASTLASRQRADGGIGYWSSSDWTSPWLSAYAGTLLLDARAAGVPVSDTVLSRLAGYLSNDLHNATTPVVTQVAHWYDRHATRLADRVAAVDFLSRLGRADVPAEHQLLALIRQLAWEDRVRLAEVIARRGMTQQATALLSPAWAQVKVEGRRATLPDSVRSEFYFPSRVRPVARLLTATLAVAPDHPLVGPLVETLADQARSGMLLWNTQDNGSLVWALSELERRQRGPAAGTLRVRAGDRVLLETGPRVATDSSVPLTGLLRDGRDGAKSVRLAIDGEGSTAGRYYHVAVRLVPLRRPERPVDEGIQVERWYERFDSPTPIASVTEGELVRVRLRVTVPADRHFVVLDDALPAGLEAVDLSLRTAAAVPGPGAARQDEGELTGEGREGHWYYGSWDSGWWSPFDHKELRDDRVVYFATVLWKGTYTASYVARATTPGVFVRPPAHAEEMYNPEVHGESDGGVFRVAERQ
ncbi:MAG TPA: MG2 domain-containing protein [Gemmatimonadaceae bacterium]|nr:MG2 domain-containing protein [Gemmatimonadaceae bacterium]